MILKVKYFGMTAEISGVEEESLNGEFLMVSDFKKRLFENYSGLLNVNFKIAVNHNLVDEKFELSNNDEIALLPPFAGG